MPIDLDAISQPPRKEVKIQMSEANHERLKRAAKTARLRPWQVLARLIEEGLPE